MKLKSSFDNNIRLCLVKAMLIVACGFSQLKEMAWLLSLDYRPKDESLPLVTYINGVIQFALCK